MRKGNPTPPKVNPCCAADDDATPGVRLTETTATVRGKRYRRLVVAYTDEHGVRRRRTFNRRPAANRFKVSCEQEVRHREARQAMIERRIGEDANKLTVEALRDALDANAILKGRATLVEAARWYGLELARRAKALPTVAELAARYMEDAVAHELRPRTIGDLRHRFARIVARFGKVRVDEVRGADVREWIERMQTADGRPAARATRNHIRATMAALFNLAVDLEYIDKNPALFSRRRRGGGAAAPAPAIFTPAQAGALMRAAAERCPELIAPLALGLFAGIRTAEIQRMTWERHIDVRAGLVKVTGDIAKKRSVRNVEMLPNLVRWLALAPTKTGAVAGQTPAVWRKRLETLAAVAGLPDWPHNGMRHSFGSYHLQHFGDPARTALQMGHRDSGDLLFEHYRQVTTREDAAAYWDIVPDRDGEVILFSVAG